MDTITFNVRDAEILYSFPQVSADLATIINNFIYIQRAAPPTYVELRNCLSKALQVGIIGQENMQFVVDKVWYDRIHQADDSAENEIESMLQFQETFVNTPFPASSVVTSAISENEYRSILANLESRWRSIVAQVADDLPRPTTPS